MQVEATKIVKLSMVLVDFRGETKHKLNDIKLRVFEGPSSFNAIFGQPCLHEMEAIPLTYHQLINYQGARIDGFHSELYPSDRDTRCG